jgi:hypothetical protein
MSAHDDVLAALLRVLSPRNGELRLLGRLHDPLLGNASDHEVFLLVPDLHLISRAREPSFGAYGFNHGTSDLLAQLLAALAELREAWEDTGAHKLMTVQLGDFFDLWREFGGVARPEQIGDGEWGALRDVLYRGSSAAGPASRRRCAKSAIPPPSGRTRSTASTQRWAEQRQRRLPPSGCAWSPSATRTAPTCCCTATPRARCC